MGFSWGMCMWALWGLDLYRCRLMIPGPCLVRWIWVFWCVEGLWRGGAFAGWDFWWVGMELELEQMSLVSVLSIPIRHASSSCRSTGGRHPQLNVVAQHPTHLARRIPGITRPTQSQFQTLSHRCPRQTLDILSFPSYATTKPYCTYSTWSDQRRLP